MIPGQKVRCINPLASDGCLVLNGEYVIDKTTNILSLGVITLVGISGNWMPSRFIEIKEIDWFSINKEFA